MTTAKEHAVERVHPPDWLMRYVANPVVRRILRKKRRSKVNEFLLLLRYRGRRTGKPYEIPVGYRDIDGRMGVLINSRWRLNFRGGADVEVVLAGEPKRARASLLEEPQDVARIYGRLIDEVGLKNANRQLGIKIHVDRRPTYEELVDMIDRSGLAVVWLDLQP